MHLSPREIERVLLFSLAEMARRRRAKGLKLNYPEALALICDEVMEAAREGASLEEAAARGAGVLGPDDVMDGVADLLQHVQVEAVFADGSRLVTVRQPIRTHAPHAAPGPSDPAPSDPAPSEPAPSEPAAPQPSPPRARVGEIRPGPGSIELNEGKPRRRIAIRNDSPYPVWVSSHFPLEQVNPRLQFDRESARGWRLDVPAGDVVLFPPGSVTEVDLVPRAPSEGGDR